MGVVHAPDSPDRGPDTIAWADGAGPIRRNGVAVQTNLSHEEVKPGSLIWATASSALRPQTWARAAAPARYVAMPSIAYRLSRIASGHRIAPSSTHHLQAYGNTAGPSSRPPGGAGRPR